LNSSVCTALVTGFDWYRGEGYTLYYPNPSSLVAERLNKRVIGECRVQGIVLSVERSSVEKLKSTLSAMKPCIVVGLGLHPGTKHPLLELAAVNLLRERSDKPSYTKLDEAGPLAVAIPIDYSKLLDYLWSKGYSVYPSNTLGTYYCNAVAYTIYSYGLKSGACTVFYHIPPVSDLLIRLGRVEECAWSVNLLVKLIEDTIVFLESECKATCT